MQQAVLLYCIFQSHRCSNPEGERGCSPLVKDQDTLIEQSVTRINKAHRITLVEQVVYDEFMKQIRTVRHSFNTTGTTNYRVQLVVSPSTNNNHNHNNIAFKKKLTNKCT